MIFKSDMGHSVQKMLNLFSSIPIINWFVTFNVNTFWFFNFTLKFNLTFWMIAHLFTFISLLYSEGRTKIDPDFSLWTLFQNAICIEASIWNQEFSHTVKVKYCFCPSIQGLTGQNFIVIVSARAVLEFRKCFDQFFCQKISSQIWRFVLDAHGTQVLVVAAHLDVLETCVANLEI